MEFQKSHQERALLTHYSLRCLSRIEAMGALDIGIVGVVA